MKVERQALFRWFIHVTKLHILLMDGSEVTLEIH